MTGPDLGFSFAVTLAMAWLGVRLLVLAARSGEIPELTLGLFFVTVGPLGFAPLLLVQALPDLRPDHLLLARAAGTTGITLAMALIGVFTWRVFRPGEPWADVLATLCLALLLAGYIEQALVWGFGPADPASPGWQARVAARLVILGWGTWEPLAYHRRLRRRRALGLADPVVANRVLLWAVWAGACLTVLLLGVARPWIELDGMFPRVRALAGATAAVAIWLALVPPPAYRRWLRRRAGERTA